MKMRNEVTSARVAKLAAKYMTITGMTILQRLGIGGCDLDYHRRACRLATDIRTLAASCETQRPNKGVKGKR